jgi:UDP-N-acetylmuramyl pentapeptide phosphotransferase/UDP-N-acetylglucosamine-1-phosphate transferase
MDGINGITAGYSLAVLIPLLLLNGSKSHASGFTEQNLIIVIIIAVLVFSFFNFRPKNKAKCFAGDVGSVGMALILIFFIGSVIVKTRDLTWIGFLLVYGVDGLLTIIHRIMLHENIGRAHRKHAYQIMANELKMEHTVVSLIYMGLQLAISLGFIYLCPATVLAHWIYMVCAGSVLVGAYVVFMKKYYHLHEEYLRSLEN